MAAADLGEFLKPLFIDERAALQLSRDLTANFRHLSAESRNQFLRTPISESMLRPVDGLDRGRYVVTRTPRAEPSRCLRRPARRPFPLLLVPPADYVLPVSERARYRAGEPATKFLK